MLAAKLRIIADEDQSGNSGSYQHSAPVRTLDEAICQEFIAVRKSLLAFGYSDSVLDDFHACAETPLAEIAPIVHHLEYIAKKLATPQEKG